MHTPSDFSRYSKTCVKRPLSKRPKIGFRDQLLNNAGQKYCRVLQGEYSAILLTFIKLPFVIKSLFCLFLSGCLRQVLLYYQISVAEQVGVSLTWLQRYKTFFQAQLN